MNEESSQESMPLTPCNCSGVCEECQCRKAESHQNATQIVPFSIVRTMIWLLLLCAAAWGQTARPKAGGPGLLIIAHGSPWQPWNQKVMEPGPKIRDSVGDENPLEGLNSQLSEQGALPGGMVTQWIVDTARGEMQRRPSRP